MSSDYQDLKIKLKNHDTFSNKLMQERIASEIRARLLCCGRHKSLRLNVLLYLSRCIIFILFLAPNFNQFQNNPFVLKAHLKLKLMLSCHGKVLCRVSPCQRELYRYSNESHMDYLKVNFIRRFYLNIKLLVENLSKNILFQVLFLNIEVHCENA